MEIIRTNQLDQKQTADISALVSECSRHDRIKLTFPAEEGDSFYLLYDGESLRSAMSLFYSERDLCECSAFTYPAARKNGYFGLLLDCAISELEQRTAEAGNDITFYFAADENCPDTLAALHSLEAEFWYRQLMMEFDCQSPRPVSLPPDLNSPGRLLIHAQRKDEFFFLLDGKRIGGCKLWVREDYACLYDFQILPQLRGRGYGTAFLQILLASFLPRNLQNIRLQVSEKNTPAVQLYKKTGFQVSETLSYYLY